MKALKTIIQILLLVIIPGIIQAIESFPPIVSEGETIPDIQDVMKDISRASAIHCIDFSPDGRTIASGSYKTIRLWDVSTGREIKRFEGHKNTIWSVNFSPDGRSIASGSDDNTIRLWDVSTGREIKRFEGHTSYILSVKFSPDGRSIASGSYDKIIRLWDVSTGREIKRFEGHTSSII